MPVTKPMGEVHCKFKKVVGNVAKMKQPKKAKKPKPINKVKLTREQKKLIKEKAKKRKALNKKLDGMIGAVAVILCIISSVLDLIVRKKAADKR